MKTTFVRFILLIAATTFLLSAAAQASDYSRYLTCAASIAGKSGALTLTLKGNKPTLVVPARVPVKARGMAAGVYIFTEHNAYSIALDGQGMLAFQLDGPAYAAYFPDPDSPSLNRLAHKPPAPVVDLATADIAPPAKALPILKKELIADLAQFFATYQSESLLAGDDLKSDYVKMLGPCEAIGDADISTRIAHDRVEFFGETAIPAVARQKQQAAATSRPAK